MKIKSLGANFAKPLLFICLGLLTWSCSNDDSITTPDTKQKNEINVSKIENPAQTRSELLTDSYTEGYLCTSPTSSIAAEIYPQNGGKEVKTFLLNDQNEVGYVVNFKIEEEEEGGALRFTAYNEFAEPLFAGLFVSGSYIAITNVYGNDVLTRASAAAWGCNIGLWACGTVWSIGFGMVSMGAGVAVGLAYTCLAVAACDGL